ncbi:SixA phosphatase family protein [Thalassobaculum salexigens]|uniref:SixA phosphatase family protein n=1 Tax=Thalassobaculum salexigens TaxID=455360 RepID=UPI0004201BB8|nr:histidine phosphatase family protein [Thalassobaculum salexigens]
MITLHLMRHAKSDWDGGEADHDRPLAPRGERAAAAMAVYCRQQGIAPDFVLCSSARRTRDTLEILRAGLPEGVPVETTRDIYMASAAQLVTRLKSIPVRTRVALVIGHNPGMEDAVGLLTGAGVGVKFPTCALATLEAASGWAALAPKGADLRRFITPKDLV